MKKGSILIFISGTLQLAFGIYLIVLCCLLFSNNSLAADLTNGFTGSFNSAPSLEVTRNGFLIIFVILSLFAIILGALCYKQIKVEIGEYYKSPYKLTSSAIYMLICSILFFILFAICKNSSIFIPLILIVAIIALLALISTVFAIIVFSVAKKKALKPKPVSIVASADHYTTLKKLNNMKESKEISEKEYQIEKEKLLGK